MIEGVDIKKEISGGAREDLSISFCRYIAMNFIVFDFICNIYI